MAAGAYLRARKGAMLWASKRVERVEGVVEARFEGLMVGVWGAVVVV